MGFATPKNLQITNPDHQLEGSRMYPLLQILWMNEMLHTIMRKPWNEDSPVDTNK